MNAAITGLRRFIPPAAWAVAALASCGVLQGLAGPGLVPAARGVAAVGCVLMMTSLVVPAISITRAWQVSSSWRDDLRSWIRATGGALGGVLAGTLVHALFCAAETVVAVVASVVVVASCAMSFAGASRALGRLFGRFRWGRLAGAEAAGAALLGLVAVPFWTGGLVRTAAGFAWSSVLIGASPFLATAMPWCGAAGPWAFDPRTSPVLYGIWVGTDVPMVMPGWVACAAGHVIFALVVIGLTEVLPKFTSRPAPSSRNAPAGGAGPRPTS